ncbi:MAG: acyltransferase [Alphaproteobacteria bacterium]
MIPRSTISSVASAAQQGKTGYRPDIEGPRGVAVLLVVAFHGGLQQLPGGFVGVDVFFVISGYVITKLLAEDTRRTAQLDLVRFYARRARRLIPAATLTIVATIVVGFAVLSPYETKELSKAALAALLFSSNIWFVTQAVDYFAADIATNPVLHTWSLGVEEQFYLFWPIIIFLAIRGAGSIQRPIAVIGAISALSFLLCAKLTAIDQPWAFF